MKGLTCIFSLALALAALSFVPRAGWAQETIVPRLSATRVNASLGVEHEWQQHDVALGFADSQQNLARIGVSYDLGTNLSLVAASRLPFDNGLKLGQPRYTIGASYNICRKGKFHL